MRVIQNGVGYMVSGFGSMEYPCDGKMFIGTFDFLWGFGDRLECVWKLDADITYVYQRKNGRVGINCGSEIFYELDDGHLGLVQPNSWDRFRNGRCGEYFLEYDSTDSSRIVNRVVDVDGSQIANYIGTGLGYLGMWAGQFVFEASGVGIVASKLNGVWDTLFVPTIPRIRCSHIFGNNVLVFGSNADRQACCEIFDLVGQKLVGFFTFDHYPGYVSEIYMHDSGWYFCWGDRLFRFDNKSVEQMLPSCSVGGYYVTAAGVCVLSGDEAVIRFYDHKLEHIKDELVIPLPGYVFSSFSSEGGKLVGYLRTASRTAGLFYAVTLSVCADGCPSLELEQALYQIEKHPRGQAFDLIVRFSEGVAFPTLLRQTLAVLDDSYSLHRNPESNPEAALFSGRVELHFTDPLPEEQKNLLQHGCQRLCALYLGREAPATGESFNFRLVFAE